MSFDITTNPVALTKIKIIGVGGAGGNAVNTLINSNASGVDFIVANTDVQDLGKSCAPTKIQLGRKLTEGLGAGGDPERGRRAAEESIQEIESALQNTNMLLITAGMGGGTGTGAAPIIAKKAKDMGILTLAVVTLPFKFEGQRKMENANAGIQNIQECVDTIIVIPNSKITEVYGNLLMKAALKKSDEIVTNAVISIADIINKPGDLNIDFADVKATMLNSGYALIGIGNAKGKDRARLASEAAISNPLLADVNLSGCRALLINVTAGHDFLMDEFDQVNEIITSKTGTSGQIKSGLILDDQYNDQLKVTIIATGLPASDLVKALPINLNYMLNAQNDVAYNNSSFSQTILQPAKEIDENRIILPNNTRVIEQPQPDFSHHSKVTAYDGRQYAEPDFLKKYHKKLQEE